MRNLAEHSSTPSNNVFVKIREARKRLLDNRYSSSEATNPVVESGYMYKDIKDAASSYCTGPTRFTEKPATQSSHTRPCTNIKQDASTAYNDLST